MTEFLSVCSTQSSGFVVKLKELTSVVHALLSSVLIHSFRLQSPEHSCSSLRDAQCIAFDEPV